MDISQILLGENDAFLHGNSPVIEKTDTPIEQASQEVSSKFDDDVARLKNHYTESGGCFLPGICIDLTLQELLSIVPRQRKRSYAYTTLINYLKNKFNITLKIVRNEKENFYNRCCQRI